MCDIHCSWQSLFTYETKAILSDIFTNIGEYYPERENVLRFARTDLNNLKCVIIGMDPYPSWNVRDDIPQATGGAFEVSELYGQTWDYPIKQASLRNILRALYYNYTGTVSSISEVRTEIATGWFKISPPDKWFDRLEEQGVLWLNSTLTVEPGKPGSHTKIWGPFRERLIPFIVNKDIPFMLWGNNAVNEVGQYIPDNLKYICPHPRVEAFINANTFKNVKNIDWVV